MSGPEPLHPLLDPVREEVLKAIKFLGAASSEEVAAMCHLSHGAARMHLVTLRNLGLVEYGRDRAVRPGRPRHLFWLTPAGDGLFPRADQEIADALLRSLKEIAPDHAEPVVAATADAQFRKVMQSLPESRWLPAAERLHAVLEHCGYFPQERTAGQGLREEILRHCPLWALAQEHPSLCDAEHRFFKLVLANDAIPFVRRLHRLEGESVCSYVFSLRHGETMEPGERHPGAVTE